MGVSEGSLARPQGQVNHTTRTALTISASGTVDSDRSRELDC
jgi:hypothetical protein